MAVQFGNDLLLQIVWICVVDVLIHHHSNSVAEVGKLFFQGVNFETSIYHKSYLANNQFNTSIL